MAHFARKSAALTRRINSYVSFEFLNFHHKLHTCRKAPSLKQRVSIDDYTPGMNNKRVTVQGL